MWTTMYAYDATVWRGGADGLRVFLGSGKKEKRKKNKPYKFVGDGHDATTIIKYVVKTEKTLLILTTARRSIRIYTPKYTVHVYTYIVYRFV